MQQQQQGGGGYNYPNPAAEPEAMAVGDEHQKSGDLGIAEAASPISSRPPAAAAIGNDNFEELMQATAEAGGSSGNRWPRQETLALLQIRSEMDAAFRDATPKAPLWEQVSRKLAELGYKRSAKKCKEKFENVHKYYKRTKEGRAGRQDGKSYKFFTQMEALDHHHMTPPVGCAQPTIPNSVAAPITSQPPLLPQEVPQDIPHQDAAARPLSSFFGSVGVSFSSNTSSDDEDDDTDDLETELADVNPHHRKRKRSVRSVGSDERMMEFFEGLMNKVMAKQEAMQQKFLEAIEKREQDRMIREEAWKRQDMVRLAREHELMAQECAISASRDAAIIAFLEKVTGQTINIPTTVPQNSTTPPFPVSIVPPSQPQDQPQSKSYQHQHDQLINVTTSQPHQSIDNSPGTITAAIPEQQMIIPVSDFTGGGSRLEASTSRWPKAEVLALIQMRSGMESKYQEVGPKGPLWEEISAGMQRMGYNRSAKRCKEKWENINKYYKKVKESNKKRPEDSKTCPYFHELEALYRRKQGNTTGGAGAGAGAGAGGASASILGGSSGQEQQQGDVGMPSLQPMQSNESEIEGGGKTEMQTSTTGAYSSTGLLGEKNNQGNVGGPAKQPEDMLEKQQKQMDGDLIDIDCFNTADCSYSDHDNDEDNYEEVDDNQEYSNNTHAKEFKMAYKMQFQKLNVGSSDDGGTASNTFMAMVQ